MIKNGAFNWYGSKTKFDWTAKSTIIQRYQLPMAFLDEFCISHCWICPSCSIVSWIDSFSNRIWYANFSPYSIGIQIFLPIFIISQCIPCCWYIICTKETFSNAWTENVQQKPSFDSYNFELLDSFDTEKTYIVWINKIILVSRSLNGH